MALQQGLQDGSQRPLDLILEEQILLHLRYVYLVADTAEFASLAEKVDGELSISRRSDGTLHFQLEQLQPRCGLPRNGWRDSDVELIRGSIRYHELCKASTQKSEQRDQIEGAIARTDTMFAEDWSGNMRLFWRSCNPSEFFRDRQGYLDTPQNRHRLGNLEAHRLEYKRVKVAVPTERMRIEPERPNKEAQHAPVCDELPLYVWVCVPKHLHAAPLRGRQRRRIGVMISVIGGGMVRSELLLCGRGVF